MSDSHANHGHDSGHGDSHASHGHDAHAGHGNHAGHAGGGHGGHGHSPSRKPPWGTFLAIGVVLVLILFYATKGSSGPAQTVTLLNVTPGADNLLHTTVGAIIDDPLSYHNQLVQVRGVLGYKDPAQAKSRHFDLADNGRWIRLNATDPDLPRQLTYQVTARVNAEKPADPVLDVLKIDPVYEEPIR